MENYVVTFARGFGTGGKEIASKLAKELGIHCYENRILTLASQMSGLDEKLFQEVNEKVRSNGGFSSFLKGLPRAKSYISRNEKFVSDDKLFEYQKQIIENLADTESCVIVGKCADYILRGRPNIVSIYIEAPRDFCVKRTMEHMGVTEDVATATIVHTDKFRADYYKYYTHGNYWTNPVNYDLTINSEKVGIEDSVKLLCLNRITEGCQILLDAIHKYGDDMDPQLRIEAGLALTRADRYPEAEQLLESYAEEGTDESLRFDCASLLMELAGEEDDTLMMDQMYQLGIKLKPDNTSIYSKYGRVLIMSGRYADAVDAYKKAVNLNKETNYYGELLQALYLRDGEIKSEYAEYLSKAVIPEEDRKTPLDYIKLARYCRVIGDYADAEKYLKQAVSMKVCSSCGYHGCEEGYYELGILYEVMGERKMAIEAYEKAIEAHGHCYVYEKRLQDLLENS